jgi:hypothetical protein
MRDIVSKHGTIRTALRSGTLPANGSNQTINGSDVNNANYNGVMFYIIPGTYTDGTHTFTIQEADDNGSGSPGSYTNVANADLVAWKATSTTDSTPVKVGNSQPAAISSSATNVYQRIGYIGAKQWVRLSVTSTGVTTGASYEAVCELGEPRNMPAAV